MRCFTTYHTPVSQSLLEDTMGNKGNPSQGNTGGNQRNTTPNTNPNAPNKKSGKQTSDQEEGMRGKSGSYDEMDHHREERQRGSSNQRGSQRLGTESNPNDNLSRTERDGYGDERDQSETSRNTGSNRRPTGSEFE